MVLLLKLCFQVLYTSYALLEYEVHSPGNAASKFKAESESGYEVVKTLAWTILITLAIYLYQCSRAILCKYTKCSTKCPREMLVHLIELSIDICCCCFVLPVELYGIWCGEKWPYRRPIAIWLLRIQHTDLYFRVSRAQMSRRPPIPRLLLNNVSCMRNAQQILRHVNVTIHDGSALVLTGANGSGKTTLLRMLAGFSKPSAGEVLWNGHDITESGIFHQYKLQLGWVSLKDAVKEKFTVLENVQWFEILEGKEGRSLAALELMGLGRLAKDKARMLSMGQRKRLQLARLLAIDRPIWLLDEPSVALDDDGVKLLEYIIAEHRKKGGIVIVATHLPIQIEDAMYLRLPPRFPRRMTLVDMLDRGDWAG
ncbi:ABC transporter I family member 1-like protein [Drosera capensis]